jgi:serine/threonine-protein kinase PpkA
MASIYLAERDEDQLKVVLKVLSLNNNDDSSLLRRFMREYKLIAQVEHPNIVQIYERAFASSFAYIAMEYFSHGDLAERLKKGLDSRTAISYLHQITEGLGAAHAKGIVHRDMKPANILFRSEDNLAVTDFGIAKAAETDQLQKQLTVDGALMGTLYYISPEQILGREADQRSDLYSLGVIMYKMLTGNHPYVGSTPTEVFEGHLNVPVPLLPEKFSSLQPLLDGLLAKDVDERFQSTEDLLMGLNWKEWN